MSDLRPQGANRENPPNRSSMAKYPGKGIFKIFGIRDKGITRKRHPIPPSASV
jgi:hypothetical protein